MYFPSGLTFAPNGQPAKIVLLSMLQNVKIKHLDLKGGHINLADVEEKIPHLCRKYNDRYYGNGKTDAFICLEDCKREDPKADDIRQHSRKLITRYNITDFEDAPISFIGNIIITKKGVGLNLQTGHAKKNDYKNKKPLDNSDDNYRFFPWFEFINLSFTKHLDERQLLIYDPYNNIYIYNSKVYFSNVELIQFFNELKALIAARVNQ